MFIKSEKVKKILIGTIFKALSIINKYIPKEEKIIFYSNFGFRDNIKALYDYVVENNYNEEYKIYCSVNDYKKFLELDIKNVYFVNNISGIFHFLTAKHVFYCFGKIPIKPAKRQKVIHLWHGTPLKKIGNLIEGENKDNFFFSKILSTSDYFSDIMAKAFGCGKENIMICGHPRNDILFKDNDIPNLGSYGKLILWTPTFRTSPIFTTRKSSESRLLPVLDEKELIEIDEILKINNVRLIIKFHPAQDLSKLAYNRYNNINIYTHEAFSEEGFDLYKLLSKVDALITDYSSIYFDYLLLNRPIGFTIEDITTYAQDRGFVFDNPLDYMPGHKIENKEQFIEFIKDINNGIDEYKLDRAKINDYVNYYKDGNNCFRILKDNGIKPKEEI